MRRVVRERTYYGVTISRSLNNSMGLHWIAKAPKTADSLYLRADTLEGIKQLIREYYHVGRNR